MTLILFERMQERVERGRADADTTYFHELMLCAEMAFKLAIVGFIAAVGDDKNRLRYQASHSVVRADGLGDWVTVLDEILTGPTLQFLSHDALSDQRELTQRVSPDSWQHRAVTAIENCLEQLDVELPPQGKIDGRRWFHLFVRLRNKTRGHGAPRPDVMSRMCPYLQSSVDLFVSNFTMFKREWAYLHRNLSGKYRVVGLGNGTLSFDHLKSKKDESHENGIHISFHAPANVGLLRSNADLGDFYLPNGDFSDRQFELMSYITGDKVFEPSKDYLAPVGLLPGSETEGIGSLEIEGHCFANLPTEQVDYVHRNDLEHELTRVLLTRDQYPIVTLYGRGGIGKTSLALRVAHSLTKVDHYSIIIWFSARDIDLLSDGPKLVKPRVLTIRDVAKEYCDLVSPSAVAEKSLKPRELFEQHLKQPALGNALYIFDNFETVTNPLEIYTWLDAFIRLPNKILITTRHREFKGDYHIKVEGMTDVEMNQLIGVTASRLKISHLLSPNYIDDVKAESDGHPYVVKMLLGSVARHQALTKVERIIASSDEILTALFERTYAKLTPAAQRCFLTICGWRSNIPVVAVEAVLLQSSEERFNVRDAIDELEDYSFIEVSRSEKDDEEFIVVPFVAAKFGQQKVSVHPLKQKITSDTELLQQFGASQPSDVRHGIGPRVARLMKFVARAVEKDHDALQNYLPMIEFIARRHPDTWILLSELFEDQGTIDDLEQAKECVRHYLEKVRGENAMQGWKRLAHLCRESSDPLGEVHALLELCEDRNVPFHEISNVANRLNSVFSYWGGVSAAHGDEKASLFERLASIMADRADEASATDLSRLAWLYMYLHDTQQAVHYTRMGLKQEPDNWYCLKLASRLGI